MRVTFIQPLAVIALCAAVVRAQPIPRPEELRPWIEAGDHRAVPIILARLREAVGRSMNDDTDRYYMMGMIQHATMYGLDEAGPLMVALFHRPDANATELELVAHSAAQYRSESALGLQKALLADPRLDDTDARVQVLAALAESTDAETANKAADALADWVIGEFQQMTPEKAIPYSFMEVVPTVRSKRFVERIAAIPMPPAPTTADAGAKATQLKTARRFLSRLQAKLAIANRAPEAIIDAIANAAADDESIVDAALVTLARIAEPPHVAALEAVRIGKDGALAANGRLVSRRKGTVAAIRRRHWEHYAELAATRPSEGEG